MECWSAPDDCILVHVEAGSCSSEAKGDLYLLLDGFGEVERIWEDDGHDGDDSDESMSYIVEGSELVGVLETAFESGRVNYDREIELEDLEPIDEEDAPEEDAVLSALATFRERRGITL